MRLSPAAICAVALAVTTFSRAEAAEGDLVQSGGDSGKPLIGLLADVGVPDGALLALALSPAEWLRLHAGGGTNSISFGVRGGLTLLPWGQGPSVSMEVGHYRHGDANGFMRRFVGLKEEYRPLLQNVGYTYANAHLGLELGARWFTFFIHGGFSYVRATLDELEQTVNDEIASPTTSVVLREDPVVRAIMPSVKLGFVVYLE